MKKSLSLCFLILLLSTFCYSLPNITLKRENEFYLTINNNNLYNENKELIGEIKNNVLVFYDNQENESYTVNEDTESITIKHTFIIDGKEDFENLQFSKLNGNLIVYSDTHFIGLYYEDSGELRRLTYYRGNHIFSFSNEYKYDMNGNKIWEIEYDENDNKLNSTQFIYNEKTKKVIKEIEYDKDDNIDGYTLYTYDKKIGNVLTESYYNVDNTLIYKSEYDPISNNELFHYDYDENGKLQIKHIYDKESGIETERHIFTASSKNPEIINFIQYNDNGEYQLNDGYYLTTSMISFWDFEDLPKNTIINWNDFYDARFRLIEYDQYYDGYKYLTSLMNNNLYFNRSFTLGKKNSDTYYCFTYTEDNKIDFSKCYEFQLIRKEVNYKAMNKSGFGKGPFGIDIGMNLEDVTKTCDGNEPEHYSDDAYYIYPANSHPLFKTYLAWISKKYGVYYIRAYSDDLTTSEYGTEVKSKFNNILNALQKKYGEFTKIDTIDSNYMYKEDKYWMKGLQEGARNYKARWHVTKDNIDDYDGITGIVLGIDIADKYSTTKAYIWIEYEFRNSDEAEELINDVL